MPTVVDYASLKQGILDWSHRADLASYADYFIQNAQASIERDIPDLNFGNYIGPQECSYGPFAIVNGVAPVPSDWLGAKVLLLSANGILNTLDSKAAAWIYDRYPLRNGCGYPQFFARDVWQSSYAQPQTFTATSGQTVFTLAFAPASSSVLLVSLDGAALTKGVSYTLSGTTLTLNTGATAGQVLAVQYLSTSSGIQTWTVAPLQTTFPLANPAASVIALTLDGAVLVGGTDYTVSGGYIQLTFTPVANQTLTAYLSVGSVLIFGPSPASGCSIQGTYYASAPLLTSAQTTNWMVTRAPDCLLDACLREAAKFLRDLQMYQGFDTTYQAKLKALVDQDKAERWAASTLQVNTG